MVLLGERPRVQESQSTPLPTFAETLAANFDPAIHPNVWGLITYAQLHDTTAQEQDAFLTYCLWRVDLRLGANQTQQLGVNRETVRSAIDIVGNSDRLIAMYDRLNPLLSRYEEKPS